MIKRLERLRNTVNKYMADIRPVSQNGSRSQVDDQVHIVLLFRNKINIKSFLRQLRSQISPQYVIHSEKVMSNIKLH
jgi:hypothetical protein